MPQFCSSRRLVLTLERRHTECFRDLVGAERPIRDHEKGMDLRDGAVNPPAHSHFAPVQDELLRQRVQASLQLCQSFLLRQK